MSKLLRHLGSFAPAVSAARLLRAEAQLSSPERLVLMPWLQPSKTQKKTRKPIAECIHHIFRGWHCVKAPEPLCSQGAQFMAAYVSKLLSEAASMN